MDTKPGPKYNYDVKIEFVLKSPGEKVYAKAIMVKTMKAIQNTIRKDEYVTFHDVDEANPVHPELRGIAPEEVANKFCFEVGGADRSIAFFGFILQSNLSFQVLKKRTFDEFKKTNTFMRLHSGGFAYGVNWSTLGFILEEHPIFTDVNTLRTTLMNKVASAWSNDSEIFTADKKADIAHTINPNSSTPFTATDIPLNIATSTVSAKNEKGETLKATVVVVTIPQKFYHIGNFIMDHLSIVRQSVTHYIPNGFKREDPEGYYEFVDQHRIWMDNHRNIPILNVTTVNQFTHEKNANQVSLKILLLGVPGIDRCNYDHVNKRVNVSVTASNFAQVSTAITSMIATAGLPFKPMVRQNYNPTGSLGSKKTGTSKYLDIVSKYKKNRSPTSSLATSAGNQSTTTAKSTRTWNTNRIPTEIDFSEDNFPPIPNKSESPITAGSERYSHTHPANYLDAVSNRIQGGYGNQSPFKPVSTRQVPSPHPTDQTESSVTIQSAISHALAAARDDHLKMIAQQQEVHRKEIETLTRTFQDQMKTFESNMQRTTNPERMEFLEDKMERSSNQMDARLDRIIDLLTLQQGNDKTGPSPYRKKTRHDTEQEPNMDIDHFDQLASSPQNKAKENQVQTQSPPSPVRENTMNDNTPQSQISIGITAKPRTGPMDTNMTIQEPSTEIIEDSTTPPPPPLPDSPGKEDSTWLRRKTAATITFTEKAKTLLNPYRTAQETLNDSARAANRMHLLNAPGTPMGVHLTTLPSSRRDTASRGRED